MTGTGGGSAGVTFYGTNGSFDYLVQTQDDYDYFDTAGLNLGTITMIELNLPIYPLGLPNPGPESLYDDVTIHVIPEPSTWILAAVAFASWGLIRLRRDRR